MQGLNQYDTISEKDRFTISKSSLRQQSEVHMNHLNKFYLPLLFLLFTPAIKRSLPNALPMNTTKQSFCIKLNNLLGSAPHCGMCCLTFS